MRDSGGQGKMLVGWVRNVCVDQVSFSNMQRGHLEFLYQAKIKQVSPFGFSFRWLCVSLKLH